jgi:lipoprotein-anchoring transpeptidase ErfK/SrfK
MFGHEPKARGALLRGLCLSVAVAAAVALPGAAQAQSLIDFLWGGSPEYGGGRQTVAFDKKYTPGQIVVSFGDRRLYHITSLGRATSYPIAVPREQSRWSGVTSVTMKKENPAWTPTPDMIRENPRLPRWVPGGHPMNPLGVRGLYLGSSTYRIHGTDAPWTIGQAVSKGCIRMFNEDVLHLYPRVNVGTKVTVTWNRFNTDEVASVEEPARPEPARAISRSGSRRSEGEAFSGFYGNDGSSPQERRTVKVRKPTLNYIEGDRQAAND